MGYSQTKAGRQNLLSLDHKRLGEWCLSGVQKAREHKWPNMQSVSPDCKGCAYKTPRNLQLWRHRALCQRRKYAFCWRGATDMGKEWSFLDGAYSRLAMLPWRCSGCFWQKSPHGIWESGQRRQSESLGKTAASTFPYVHIIYKPLWWTSSCRQSEASGNVWEPLGIFRWYQCAASC